MLKTRFPSNPPSIQTRKQNIDNFATVVFWVMGPCNQIQISDSEGVHVPSLKVAKIDKIIS